MDSSSPEIKSTNWKLWHPPVEGERWWSPERAVIAGILGALINSLAIWLTKQAGIAAGTGGFAKWLFAHLNLLLGTSLPEKMGPIGQEVFHTSVGVVSALIFAGVFYRIMPGPGWLRGLIYCQGMWAVQALFVLPWLGNGYFGTGISASAPFWSWSLNALFGVLIGWLYRPRRKRP
ncbi:hypothetical protein [Blastopirellula marina]|uniref:hypothetical protein n=1 Tax=Blastopirellula marina TaxID=124 RepID=UPI0011B0051B|nr:hypothetical protein [Blastopirellula marina]